MAPGAAGGGTAARGGFVKVLTRSTRHCLAHVLNVIPPEPSVEVAEILQELKLDRKHVHEIYGRFLQLRRKGSGLASRRQEVKNSICLSLVKTQKEWVHKILKYLLELGGQHDMVTWDGFIFCFLQFCRLSKLELAQFMFYAIGMEMKSWSIHFITSTQLEEFYSGYHNCPVLSFNTGYIDFGRLPLAKYRIFEFVELTYRFGELINPALHLQRELQRMLPSMDFWKDYQNVKAMNRKIGIDHFRRAKVLSIEDAVAISEGRKVRMAREDRFTIGKIIDVPQLPAKQETRPGFLPLPLGPPKTKRLPKVHEPELPAWMQEHLKQNVDPISGRELGSSAEASMVPDVPPPLPENWQAVHDPAQPKRLYYWNRETNEVSWTPPPLPRLSVEQAQDVIRATMGDNRKHAKPDGFIHGLVSKPTSRDAAQRVEEQERTQELTFVLESRKSFKTRPSHADGLLSTSIASIRRLVVGRS
mmetsp:Transcript_80697/g.231796  ORF Transcript_80697/g.231796 Transcript_80697/m.231796 type:complete len:473 (+) Transcript_80697:43-1461(+)